MNKTIFAELPASVLMQRHEGSLDAVINSVLITLRKLRQNVAYDVLSSTIVGYFGLMTRKALSKIERLFQVGCLTQVGTL